MTSCGTFQKLRPLSLLAHLSNCYDSAHLKVLSKSVSWSIYLENGKIIYASHSVDPFDRLDCHLRRLAHKIPTLGSETRSKLRLIFDNEIEDNRAITPDYQAICWLIERNYIDQEQAVALIEGLVREVIESFLLVKEGSYELGGNLDSPQELCQLDLSSLLNHAQKQLHSWQALAPQITSPYQRPYLSNSYSRTQHLSAELRQKLTAILKGFSFRHLAILLNQDELRLAQSLHPYIATGNILLHEPHQPFDLLPKTWEAPPEDRAITPASSYKLMPPVQNERSKPITSLTPVPLSRDVPENSFRTPEPIGKSALKSPQSTPPLSNIPDISDKKTYKIVCVDDSPAMLKELSYFLDDESFSVSTISDSIKALMQIVRLKPDLILLDVKMAGIDGYELCRLLRNHSFFRTTPIIMVTGNTGIIDRVKARMVGASGYLTKPFTQSELVKMVFRHLS